MKWSEISFDPVRGNHVLSTCDVSGEGITSEGLRQFEQFPHVRKLILRNNLVDSLTHLKYLRALAYLDASNNKLERALDFFPPKCKLVEGENDVGLADEVAHERPFADGDMCIGSQLVVAVLRENCISNVQDLHWHSKLQELDVSRNRITGFGTSLHRMRFLTRLNVSSNCLRDLQGVTAATSLKELVLDCNFLTDLTGIHHLQDLALLSANSNYIHSVDELKFCPRVQVVSLRDNNLRSFEQVKSFSDLEYLAEVNLQGNEVAEARDYRDTLIYLLQDVVLLDGGKVTHEDKVRAQNLFGADLASRKAYYEKYLDKPFRNYARALELPETTEEPGSSLVRDLVADAMRKAVVECMDSSLERN